MPNRDQRLDNILNYRLRREQLYQRRAAICGRWLQAAQGRLLRLRQTVDQVRANHPPSGQAYARWYQDQQSYLRALHTQIAGLQHLRIRLQHRLQRRQSQLTIAAQYRRATETALARVRGEVTRDAAQNKDKEFTQLVQLKFTDQQPSSDAAIT